MAGDDDGGGRETLPRSGSRLWPVTGYATVAVFALLALADGLEVFDLPLLAACALVGALVFLVLQRPAVAVDRETLHLRGVLSEVHVPLAAVERAVVQRFLAVFAGERRYVSTSVQRSLRAVMGRRPAGERRPGSAGTPDRPAVDEADLVEQRISQLADEARARAGVRRLSDEQRALAAGVRRTWSPAALALVAVPSLVLVAALLLPV